MESPFSKELFKEIKILRVSSLISIVVFLATILTALKPGIFFIFPFIITFGLLVFNLVISLHVKRLQEAEFSWKIDQIMMSLIEKYDAFYLIELETDDTTSEDSE